MKIAHGCDCTACGGLLSVTLMIPEGIAFCTQCSVVFALKIDIRPLGYRVVNQGMPPSTSAPKT